MAQEAWLVEKSQKRKRGGNNFSLVYVKTQQVSSRFVCSDWACFYRLIFSSFLDIFLFVCTSGIFFFLNLYILEDNYFTILWEDKYFHNYMEILNWCLMWCWIWSFLPFGCWIFLIFKNYSWHCLQTLLISWKQLYFLKACSSGFLAGAAGSALLT